MELAIDTSTRHATVGLSREGNTIAELAWRSERNHSVELVPAIQRILAHARTDIRELSAVYLAVGPGGFSALRVGMSTAIALATAREIQALLPESSYVALMRALGSQAETNGTNVQATLKKWVNPADEADMADALDRFVHKYSKPMAQQDVEKKPEAQQPAAWPRLFETDTTRYGTFRIR